jgi:hypothetical protein
VLNAVGLTALRDGTLLLPLNDVVTEPGFISRNATLHILRSTDEGATWQNWQPVAESILEPFTYGQIVELGDGTLLCPIWGRWRSEERWRSGALFSSDGGRSWGEPVSIAYDPSARLVTDYAQSAINGFDEQGNVDMGAISSPTFRPHSSIDGFTETSVIELAGGRLLALLRQQGVEGDQTLFFYRALSSNGGRSWSPYQRTSLRGMSPCLHHAPDGRLLLAYRRYAPDGDPASAPGLSIAASDDDGATWETITTLVEPKGTQYIGEYQVGYPALANLPDGRIFALYYSYDEALPWRRYLAANILS